MKVLLLLPRGYSYYNSILNAFKNAKVDTFALDYEDFFVKPINYFIRRFDSLPNILKNNWKKYYIKRINIGYSNIYNNIKPDLVFIYNNQLIETELIKQFKTKSKIIFYLGDHPLYSPTAENNLELLFHSDYTICPDTFWIQQLKMMGIKNLVFDLFGFDDKVYFPFTPSDEEFREFASDLVYIGSAHKNSWGYKRFYFLNQFAKFDVRFFLNEDGAKKWVKYFPDIKEKIIYYSGRNQSFNNLVCNCSKIYPIDISGSVFNGIHIRLLDCIGSGILPLVEFTKDLKLVFGSIEVPTINSYGEIPELTKYYLSNEDYRKKIIGTLRKFVIDNYSPNLFVNRILSNVC